MVITRSMARTKQESGVSSTSTPNPICPDSNKKLVSFQLPFDLIIEILSRLPVKSLFRFMLVSKTWYSLIQSPNFVRKHQTDGPVFTSILKHTSNDRLYLYDEGSYKMINFDFLFLSHGYMTVVGICGALVCATFDVQDSDYIICNPATREFRQTSEPNFPAGSDRLVFSGFTSFANEYKLVRVVCATSTAELVLKAEFYTMSTDVWVEIDVKMGRVDGAVDLRYYDCCYYTTIPVILNGICYWEATTSIDMRVVSFDISSGLFDQFDVPVRFETLEADEDHWKIIEFKEKLCFIVSHNDRTFDLWALDENMISWTHKLRIGNIPIVVEPVQYEIEGHKIKVVGYTRSGELLIEDWANWNIVKMLLYDLNSRETKVLSRLDVNTFDMCYFYTESLCLVKPRNDVKEAD